MNLLQEAELNKKQSLQTNNQDINDTPVFNKKAVY
jgi:hypothetical protein